MAITAVRRYLHGRDASVEYDLQSKGLAAYVSQEHMKSMVVESFLGANTLDGNALSLGYYGH